MKAITIAAATLAMFSASTQAISINWIGYANNNQWNTPANWAPEQVPGINDDVTINSGVVQITTPVGVNSLTMGTSFNAPANLTLFADLAVGNGGMTVDGNGNVFLNSGAATLSGVVNVGGNFYFQSGAVAGEINVNSRGVADLSGLAQKALIGCAFNAAGALTIGGNLVLNQSSVVSVTSSATLSGNVGLQQGDSSTVSFDASQGTVTYNGGGTLLIQAPVSFGTFNYKGGNITILDSMSFSNAFAIPSGSFVSTAGSASVDMSAGVSGAGVLSASSTSITFGDVAITGALNLLSGAANFNGNNATVNVLTVAGGQVNVAGNVASTQLNLLAGSVAGSYSLSGQKGYIDSQGFDVNGVISYSGNAVVGGATILAFGQTGVLNIANGGSLTIEDSIQFTGQQGAVLKNEGTVTVKASTAFQNVNVQGSGSFAVSSTVSVGVMSFAQDTVTLNAGGVVKGSNSILNIGSVVGSPVHAVFGAYEVQCPTQCDNVRTGSQPTSSFNLSA